MVSIVVVITSCGKMLVVYHWESPVFTGKTGIKKAYWLGRLCTGVIVGKKWDAEKLRKAM